LEIFFIGMCVALGQFQGRPFSVSKTAAYMCLPRTTVVRRLDRLQTWGLIYRQGRRYYMAWGGEAIGTSAACSMRLPRN
jgi:DNA-binding IclR family transcriptional regulator